MSKSIAVLLTVFNRKDCTLRCLQQLQAQKISESIFLDIYIIDGGSNDGTVESVKVQFPQVNIRVVEGVFWNRGMYAAWEWAASEKKYNYYLWMNDDTFVYPNCISSLLDESTRNQGKSIIVGATVDTKTKSKQTYGGRLPNGTFPQFGSSSEVNHFNGNIVLIPETVYNILGNLDSYYTHSKGDFDYGIRARKAGVKMIQAANALGECDIHPRIDKWCDPRIPFAQRWKLMKKPNGMPPNESFHLNRKLSLISAIKVYITIHIRCLFPQLWISLGKAKLNN